MDATCCWTVGLQNGDWGLLAETSAALSKSRERNII